MDKQKQIEEMAKVIAVARKEIPYDNGKMVLYLYRTNDEIAEALYNAGYRKIPEGAVVLTGEEKQKLLHEMYEQGKFDGVVKFAERVKMAFYYEFDELIPSIMADKIDEICKDISEGNDG